MSKQSIPHELRRPRGIAGSAFVVFALIAGAGLALDFSARDIDRFWLAADPGLSAAIGMGGACIAVAMQQLAQLVLSRPIDPPKSAKENRVDRA
jgi:hypothetical protein